MLETSLNYSPTAEDVIDACWSRIGARGDQSCPRLQEFYRCLNCPTYAASAVQLLDRPARTELDAANLHWQGEQAEAGGQECVDASALIFRIGHEWLGLPTIAIVEVIDSRAMHSLPHQSNPAVLGLTNIRGALKICVALGRMLGMADSTVKTATRALVVQHEQQVLVFPVDEVAGVHGYATASLQPPPSMTQQTGSAYTRAVLSWREHKVGLLDDALLFYALNRSLI
jgi:chemotaxis-related protein WspD